MSSTTSSTWYNGGMDNKTFMMPLADILNSYDPAYPHVEGKDRVELWEFAFQICRDDADVVKNLIAEYKRDESFREPVILPDGKDPDESHVHNGMHRLTASHDMGVTDVLVGEGYFFSTDPWLEVEGTSSLDSDAVWDRYDERGSCPLTENFWLEIDSMSTSARGEGTAVSFCIYDHGDSPEILTRILSHLVRSFELDQMEYTYENDEDMEEEIA